MTNTAGTLYQLGRPSSPTFGPLFVLSPIAPTHCSAYRAVFRDETIYREADKFMPERFCDEGAPDSLAIAFGFGRRCVLLPPGCRPVAHRRTVGFARACSSPRHTRSSPSQACWRRSTSRRRATKWGTSSSLRKKPSPALSGEFILGCEAVCC